MEEHLIQGQNFANQLQFLVRNRNSVFDDGNLEDYVKDLTTKILKSFNGALAALRGFDNPPAAAGVDPPHTTSPTSDESRDRKAGSKRRKTMHTWVRITPAPIDDGHAWRKYGQKEIHNNKFPRSYFRCTHKTDQGCKATKQVQKMEDTKSPMYQTTYIGHHTCKETLRTHHFDDELIGDDSSTPSSETTCFINFGSKRCTTKPGYTYSSLFTDDKQPQEDVLISKDPILLPEFLERAADLGCPAEGLIQSSFTPEISTLDSFRSTTLCGSSSWWSSDEDDKFSSGFSSPMSDYEGLGQSTVIGSVSFEHDDDDRFCFDASGFMSSF